MPIRRRLQLGLLLATISICWPLHAETTALLHEQLEFSAPLSQARIDNALPDPAEDLLQAFFSAFNTQDATTVNQQLDQLNRRFPQFVLANKLQHDWNQFNQQAVAQTLDLQTIKQTLLSRYPEANARLSARQQSIADEQVPDLLLHPSTTHQHILIAELETSRLYLFANSQGRLRLLANHYITQGKQGMRKQREGDLRTPLGIYQIQSYLPDSQLPTLYGHGAYPLNYPNAWDRLAGRTGHGIWIHGVPHDTYSRPPRDSEGCVVISNASFDRLQDFVQLGETPVLLTDRIHWISTTELAQQQTIVQRAFNAWLRDWQSLDVDSYLAHYSPDFRSFQQNYRQWLRHKRQAATQKSFINVAISELEILRYPGEEQMIEVRFLQDYQSNNYQSTSRKQQFWRQEPDGQWRIIFENERS